MAHNSQVRESVGTVECALTVLEGKCSARCVDFEKHAHLVTGDSDIEILREMNSELAEVIESGGTCFRIRRNQRFDPAADGLCAEGTLRHHVF